MTDDVNWLDLADQASVDPLELKRRLDLVAVCAELGILLEEGQDGRWSGLCPFHDDHRPSFDVYETDDGFQRCGCWACDFGPANDVYDLLRALHGYSFGQALHRAQELSVATRATDARERKAIARVNADLGGLVESASARAPARIAVVKALLSERSIKVPAEWVVQEFNLGVTPDDVGVVIPHRAADGTVTGAKTRRSTFTEERPWCPVAIGGSKLRQLYGVWRDQGRKKVVLVEGESDTWTLAWLLRHEEYEVFGLPSGAASRPRREWVEYLTDREVTLMFDADDGGRVALRNWMASLAVCSVAQLREGLDVTGETPARALEALHSADRYGLAPASGLVEAPYGGHLVRAGDDNQTMICNFLPRLIETVVMPDGNGLVFRLDLRGRVVELASSTFNTDRAMRQWANNHGLTWQGATKDAQEMHRMLELESVFHPRVIGVRTAGWVEDAFVMPEPHGVIGSRAWTYVAPETVRNLDELITLERGPWDPQLPNVLTALHQPDVITPIVGWVAASLLRPFVQAFPILAVVGVAGAGKSTLLREVLGTFGFKINLTLTSTTPWSVSMFAGSTNALPVWFDEYRAGARENARTTFEQVLRDAWESQNSYKGGFGEQRQEVHSLPASAPIVVTGEDAFQETSHLERMVLINLPRTGRNPAALDTLYAIERAGFGRVYLEWLIDLVRHDMLPEPPHVNDRPAHARAVAAWGYDVLQMFAREVCGVDLVAFDDRRIVASHEAASAAPLVVELILACENRMTRGGMVAWREGEDMCVKVHDLVREARDLQFPIPGGARALRNELGERFTVVEERSSEGTGSYLRLVGFET